MSIDFLEKIAGYREIAGKAKILTERKTKNVQKVNLVKKSCYLLLGYGIISLTFYVLLEKV